MKIAFAGCIFSLCLLSIVSLAETAAAQDTSGYLVPSAHSSGFGSGPMAISLLGSARMTAPVRGTEPGNVTPSTEIAHAREASPSIVAATTPETLIAAQPKSSGNGRDLVVAR